MPQIDSLLDYIESTTNITFSGRTIRSVGGGSINAAYQIDGTFLKVNSPHLSSMFEAEAAGLSEMAASNTIRIPEVLSIGNNQDYAYLLLEYIPLKNLRGAAAILCGEQLAQMHQQTQPYFGWHQDNTIGSTPQHNDRDHDWSSFYQQQRISQQLSFAKQNGFGGTLQDKGHRLIESVPSFFSNYQPDPALLHGDLWGGNAGADDQGNPVIFDPACYYGDREADIAMTELFGGFSPDFYAAYRATYPLDSGYTTRKTLYNLYHILNHLNLFGGGYLSQSESMIDQLLAEI